MLKIAEIRNAYVHYKWKAVDMDSDEKAEQRTVLEDIEKTIKYFQSYERKHFFGNSKNQARHALFKEGTN
jgi:hypothetical protein